MEYAIAKISHIRLERAISVAQWLLIAALIGLYAYFVVMTVIHVVLRQEYVVALNQAEASVSELESRYLVQERAFSEERAAELGMVPLTPVAYVDVTSDGRLSRRP